jgi:hypothetical protein
LWGLFRGRGAQIGHTMPPGSVGGRVSRRGRAARAAAPLPPGSLPSRCR